MEIFMCQKLFRNTENEDIYVKDEDIASVQIVLKYFTSHLAKNL